MWLRFCAEMNSAPVGFVLGYFTMDRYITAIKVDEEKVRLLSRPIPSGLQGLECRVIECQ